MIRYTAFLYIIITLHARKELQETWITWANAAPESIPFNRSGDITDYSYLNFSGNYQLSGGYNTVDTWYPTWNMDNTMFSPFTDGTIICSTILPNGTKNSNYNVTAASYTNSKNTEIGDWNTTVGHATITGTCTFNFDHDHDINSNYSTNYNCQNITLINCGTITSSSYPYVARYPCGSFSINNTWFYGTYTVNKTRDCQAWCILGPFVGFRWSFNNGLTWNEPRFEMKNASDNIFGETIENENGQMQHVKFGSPHVVDFGQNMQYSILNNNLKQVYIIGHGSNISSSNVTWAQGDQIYMARCYPNVSCVTNRDEWQFFHSNLDSNSNSNSNSSGVYNSGVWYQGDVSMANPLFTWKNRTGIVTMT